MLEEEYVVAWLQGNPDVKRDVHSEFPIVISSHLQNETT